MIPGITHPTAGATGPTPPWPTLVAQLTPVNLGLERELAAASEGLSQKTEVLIGSFPAPPSTSDEFFRFQAGAIRPLVEAATLLGRETPQGQGLMGVAALLTQKAMIGPAAAEEILDKALRAKQMVSEHSGAVPRQVVTADVAGTQRQQHTLINQILGEVLNQAQVASPKFEAESGQEVSAAAIERLNAIAEKLGPGDAIGRLAASQAKYLANPIDPRALAYLTHTCLLRFGIDVDARLHATQPE